MPRVLSMAALEQTGPRRKERPDTILEEKSIRPCSIAEGRSPQAPPSAMLALRERTTLFLNAFSLSSVSRLSRSVTCAGLDGGMDRVSSVSDLSHLDIATVVFGRCAALVPAIPFALALDLQLLGRVFVIATAAAPHALPSRGRRRTPARAGAIAAPFAGR